MTVGEFKKLLENVPDNFELKVKIETGCDSWGINYEDCKEIFARIDSDNKCVEIRNNDDFNF